MASPSLGFGRDNYKPSGSPFTAGSAINGLSVNAAGKIVLGNDTGGTTAKLLSAREVPMNGFNLMLSGATGNLLIGTVTDNAKGRLQVNGKASFLNGALFINTGGFGGAPSLETTSFLTLINTSNLIIDQGSGTGFPEFRLTNAGTTIVNPFCGVIDGFNFNAAANNVQNFLICTSAINVELANHPSGNIILRPNCSTNLGFAQQQNQDLGILLNPSRNGVVQISNNGTTPAVDGALLMISGYSSRYGSLYERTQTVAVNTVLDDTNSTIFVDATAGNITITLPTAASSFKSNGTINAGKSYTIMKIDATANTVTIAAVGADTINGAGIALSAALVPVTVRSAGGTLWFIV